MHVTHRDHYNFPPCIHVIHFDLENDDIPDLCKRVIRSIYRVTKLTIAICILNCNVTRISVQAQPMYVYVCVCVCVCVCV